MAKTTPDICDRILADLLELSRQSVLHRPPTFEECGRSVQRHRDASIAYERRQDSDRTSVRDRLAANFQSSLNEGKCTWMIHRPYHRAAQAGVGIRFDKGETGPINLEVYGALSLRGKMMYGFYKLIDRFNHLK